MKLKQIGSNQTELELNNGTRVLFSYETPVAALIERNHCDGQRNFITNEIIVTGTKYSKTTTKHINKWVNLPEFENIGFDYRLGQFTTREVDQSVLDELIK